MSTTAVRRVISTLGPIVMHGVGTFGPGDEVRMANHAARIGRALCGDSPVEQFWCLMLDAKHHLTMAALVSTGSLTNSIVHPREVFGPAIRMGAATVLVLHNHPSGDPTPSAEDIQVTRRLTKSGLILGVPLLDHVVIGDRGHVSIRESNALLFKKDTAT